MTRMAADPMREPVASRHATPFLPRLRLVEPRPPIAYTRFVTLMKFVLPAIAAALLLLIAAWPQVKGGFDRVRSAFDGIDLSEARDLRMVNARFTGVDRADRPFAVSADVVRQLAANDELVALREPKADLFLKDEGWVGVTAQSGVYQPRAQVLDLLGDVRLRHHTGFEFTTAGARVDIAAGEARGNDPVAGAGPQGEIAAEGFFVRNRGETLVFTGKSRLVLRQMESRR